MVHRNIVVFDVDKTLINGDLYQIIIGKWVAAKTMRTLIVWLVGFFHVGLIFGSVKRRFEYFIFIFISDNDIGNITKNILNDGELVNSALLRRIERYKRVHCDVVLVTATLPRIVKALAEHIGVPYYASSGVAGVVIRDLLAKKRIAYDEIHKNGFLIRTIYSDSFLDFTHTTKNILVRNAKLERCYL